MYRPSANPPREVGKKQRGRFAPDPEEAIDIAIEVPDEPLLLGGKRRRDALLRAGKNALGFETPRGR